jgi:hypothetical protein
VWVHRRTMGLYRDHRSDCCPCCLMVAMAPLQCPLCDFVGGIPIFLFVTRFLVSL